MVWTWSAPVVENQRREELDIRESGAAAMALESECHQLFKTNRLDQADTSGSQEAYARTLVAGHWNPTHPVPPECGLYRILMATRRYCSEVANQTPTDFQTYPISKDEIFRFKVAVQLQEKRRFFSRRREEWDWDQLEPSLVI